MDAICNKNSSRSALSPRALRENTTPLLHLKLASPSASQISLYIPHLILSPIVKVHDKKTMRCLFGQKKIPILHWGAFNVFYQKPIKVLKKRE